MYRHLQSLCDVLDVTSQEMAIGARHRVRQESLFGVKKPV